MLRPRRTSPFCLGLLGLAGALAATLACGAPALAAPGPGDSRTEKKPALPPDAPAVRLHTIALRSTLDRLEDLVAFCDERFGLPLRISELRSNRMAEGDHLLDMPRLREVRPLAARRPELFYDSGFPACIYTVPALRARLDEPTNRTYTTIHTFDLGMEGAEHEVVKRGRTQYQSPRCAECILLTVCGGAQGAYLDRLGDDDLIPITDPGLREAFLAYLGT